MVKDLKSIKHVVEKKFQVEGEDAEKLLFNFLQELIFLKDAKLLLFNKFEFEIVPKKNKFQLSVKAYGEKLRKMQLPCKL